MNSGRKQSGTGWICSGQAATEFVIAAVFLLVPLFIIIPIVGSYIDIKHAAIGQARYEAWEYTVWFGPDENIMSGVDDNMSTGVKTYEKTRQEGLHYMLSNFWNDSYVNDTSYIQPNLAWTDHHGQSLFYDDGEDLGRTGDISEGRALEKSVLGALINGSMEAWSFVAKGFGTLLKGLNVKAKFDAIDTAGYFKSEVNYRVNSLDDILPVQTVANIPSPAAPKPLTFSAKAAVQTNNWNAAGREHAAQESRGLILTALLSPVSDSLNTIVAGIEKVVNLFPIKTFEPFGFPDFGYVKDDLIPYEHLKESNKETKTSYKLNYYGEKEEKK